MTDASPPSSVIALASIKGSKSNRRSQAKWGVAVVKFGYTQIPTLLLRAQAKLGLTPEQLNVLLHLIEAWWEADKNPYPSIDTIATRMGKSRRMVMRYLDQLERKGLIKRIPRYLSLGGQTSNEYSLNGLVTELRKVEPAFRKVVEQNKIRRKKVEARSGVGA